MSSSPVQAQVRDERIKRDELMILPLTAFKVRHRAAASNAIDTGPITQQSCKAEKKGVEARHEVQQRKSCKHDHL